VGLITDSSEIWVEELTFFYICVTNTKNMKHQLLVFIFLGCLGWSAQAQDTIVFKNGDKIIGELKSLDKGVISFETDYSDSDFQIEWKGVDNLSTGTIFLITKSNGDRLSGTITSGDTTGFVINNGGQNLRVEADDIVYLKSLDQGFWSKINAHIDIGFNITKSNNLRQFTVNSGIGYMGEKWMWDLRYNSLNATQDSVSPTLRRDGGITVNRYLQHDVFATASVDFLSNTEQLLDLRLNGRIGLGYFFAHKNSWFWNAAGGVAIVDEAFSNGENPKSSMEAFISTELNLFDIGDLSFYTKVVSYLGITEPGRFRSDINLDIKYDLPLDFYIKGGLTVNYDNQPTAGATETDYVLNTGFGWEW